MGHALQ